MDRPIQRDLTRVLNKNKRENNVFLIDKLENGEVYAVYDHFIRRVIYHQNHGAINQVKNTHLYTHNFYKITLQKRLTELRANGHAIRFHSNRNGEMFLVDDQHRRILWHENAEKLHVGRRYVKLPSPTNFPNFNHTTRLAGLEAKIKNQSVLKKKQKDQQHSKSKRQASATAAAAAALPGAKKQKTSASITDLLAASSSRAMFSTYQRCKSSRRTTNENQSATSKTSNPSRFTTPNSSVPTATRSRLSNTAPSTEEPQPRNTVYTLYETVVERDQQEPLKGIQKEIYKEKNGDSITLQKTVPLPFKREVIEEKDLIEIFDSDDDDNEGNNRNGQRSEGQGNEIEEQQQPIRREVNKTPLSSHELTTLKLFLNGVKNNLTSSKTISDRIAAAPLMEELAIRHYASYDPSG